MAGAVLLVALSLMPAGAALRAVGKGGDVYLFLTGMMLLSETARAEGVFDWVAATAARHAGGSSPRLFLLVYGTGVVVTTFLSNDATAVSADAGGVRRGEDGESQAAAAVVSPAR